MDLWRIQLLAVKRQPEGKEIRSSTTRKVCRESSGHHRSKVSLLSGAQRVELPLQPLSLPTAFLDLCGHWEGLSFEQACPPLRRGSPLSMGSGGLSATHPKASLGISTGHPYLRRESTDGGRG